MVNRLQKVKKLRVTDKLSEKLEARYACIPPDFPRPEKAALMGKKPCFSSVAYKGKYYRPLHTPSGLYPRWKHFAEMAKTLARLAKRQASRNRCTVPDALNDYWLHSYCVYAGTAQELSWTVGKSAEILQCERPSSANYVHFTWISANPLLVFKRRNGKLLPPIYRLTVPPRYQELWDRKRRQQEFSDAVQDE